MMITSLRSNIFISSAFAHPRTRFAFNLASASTSATATSSPSPFQVFDRQAKLKQRARVLRVDQDKSRATDYVREEVAIGLVDRLMDIKRKYPVVVDLGSGAGALMRELESYEGIEKVIMTDSSKPMLWRDAEDDNSSINIERIEMDEECSKLAPDAHDCIMSCLSLHWINDLPGTLVQIKNALKPDGVFIGAMFGGDTLFELRTALQLAEQERQGGISARVSPMTDCRSMSSLINRAGFSIPTVDIDEVTVHYPSMFELIDDLRWMGESNALLNRRTFLRRDTLLAAAAIYQALYQTNDKDKGSSIPATFQVIYFIGWKPDASQHKPIERGSAERSLKELGSGSPL